MPYAAWGLKDELMDVRVAAADFVLTALNVHTFAAIKQLSTSVTMQEKSKRKGSIKISVVKDSILDRLVKLIMRNRTDLHCDEHEKRACQKIATLVFRLAPLSALKSHVDFQNAIDYIKTLQKSGENDGKSPLLKVFWEKLVKNSNTT